MKRNSLSPVVSLLASLSLALGILVADVTGLGGRAQAQTVEMFSLCSAPTAMTGAVTIADAPISASLVSARGVYVNGVEVDGVFGSGVRAVDSTMFTISSISVNVISYSTGAGGCADGVIASGSLPTSGDIPTTGVIASGSLPASSETPTSGVIASGSLTIDGVVASGEVVATGGVVEGDNVRVIDGVITGENLRLVGTVLSGDGLTTSSALANPFGGE